MNNDSHFRLTQSWNMTLEDLDCSTCVIWIYNMVFNVGFLSFFRITFSGKEGFSLPKKEHSVIIYSPSYSKPELIYFSR